MSRTVPLSRTLNAVSSIPGRCLLLATLVCSLLACGGGQASNAPPAASPSLPSARSPVPAAPSPVTPIPEVPSGPNGLTEMTRIPLPGAAGPAGTMVVDPAGRAVYLLRTGADVVVIDPATKAAARVVTSVPDPRGIAADGRFLYLTSGKTAELNVVSPATRDLVRAIKTRGAKPGQVWVDAARDRLDVLDEGRRAVEMYSAGPAPTFQAEIALPAAATGPIGVGALDAGHDLLYLPVGPAIAWVDLGRGRPSVERFSSAGAADLTALVYDGRANALWATSADRRVVVLDAGSFRVLATLPGGTGQGLAIDPALRFVYVFGGTGFWAYSTNWLVPWSRVDLGSPGAAAGAVDPATHDLYVDAGGTNAVVVYDWLNGVGGGSAGGGATTSTAGGTPGATPAAAPRLIPIVSPTSATSGASPGGTAGSGGASPTSVGSSSAGSGSATSGASAGQSATGTSGAPTSVPVPTSAPVAAPTTASSSGAGSINPAPSSADPSLTSASGSAGVAVAGATPGSP